MQPGKLDPIVHTINLEGMRKMCPKYNPGYLVRVEVIKLVKCDRTVWAIDTRKYRRSIQYIKDRLYMTAWSAHVRADFY